MTMKTKLGICWFQPEQWEEAKSLFVDSDVFGATYEDWRKSTNNAYGHLQAAGGIPVKVKVNLAELAAWCSKKDLQVNVDSCSAFIAEKMRNKS